MAGSCATGAPRPRRFHGRSWPIFASSGCTTRLTSRIASCESASVMHRSRGFVCGSGSVERSGGTRFELSTAGGTIRADAACQRSPFPHAPSLNYSPTSAATRCTATTSRPSLPAATRTGLASTSATAITRASRCWRGGFSAGRRALTTTRIPAVGKRASADSTQPSPLARYLVCCPYMAATSLTAGRRQPPSAVGRAVWRHPGSPAVGAFR